MRSRLKGVLFGIIWLALFLEILFNPAVREELYQILLQHPLLAPVAFIVLQTLFASLALPCSPLTVLAGFLWGPGAGMLYSILATLIASLSTFILGRYFLKHWLLEKTHDNWRAPIVRLIDRYKWKASLIAHANPVFPGSSLGYAFGISNISMGAFFFGALAGTLPLQILMVTIGDITRRVSNADFGIQLVLFASAAFIALMIYKWGAVIFKANR